MTMRVSIIGAPASGKSTLTDRLLAADPSARAFGVRSHFHAQIKADTAIGRAAREVVAQGGWIPDELVAKAVRTQFEDGSLQDSFVFEGMPGNRRQAELLDEVLDGVGLPLDGVIHVDTAEEVCRSRAAGRTVCVSCDGGAHQARHDPARPDRCLGCGGPISRRDADAPDYVLRRLALHREQGPEIVEYYRGPRLLEIDGSQSADEVLRQALVWLSARSGVADGGRA